MKLIKGILATISCMVICMCVGVTADAANMGEDQALITNYYEALDNAEWDTWLSLMGTKYANNMESYLNSKYYQENNMGVYVIDDVCDVTSIQKIDSQDYGSTTEECEGEEHDVYLVQVELSVVQQNQFYFDGTNYNLVFVGTVDGERKIVGIRLPLTETIEEYKEEGTSKTYEIKRFGTNAVTYSTSGCSYTTNPSTIKVLRWQYGNGQIETVDFKKYVKVVMAREYGYAGYEAGYHYAGAYAVKMYAFRKIMIADPNAAYHVTDTNNTNNGMYPSHQVYDPDGGYWNANVWGTIYNRVDDMWDRNMYGTGYSLMDLQYKQNEGGAHSGIMNQTELIAKIKAGEGYVGVLNYFYGNSNISSGDITFATAGNHVPYSSVTLGSSITNKCRCGYKWTIEGGVAINSLKRNLVQ